jgi:hypothetical protein
VCSPESPVIEKELTGLFTAMATKTSKAKPKNYADIPYFNGGIFDSFEPVELRNTEIRDLFKACEEDWSKVRPSIFGSIFEATVDAEKTTCARNSLHKRVGYHENCQSNHNSPIS